MVDVPSLFNKATLATRGFVAFMSKEADATTKTIYEDQCGRIAILIALIYLGVSLLRFVFGIAKFIFIYFLRPAKNLKFYGSWAVVTGATDGIGKAYCVELAKKGMSLKTILLTPFQCRSLYRRSTKLLKYISSQLIFQLQFHASLYNLQVSILSSSHAPNPA